MPPDCRTCRYARRMATSAVGTLPPSPGPAAGGSRYRILIGQQPELDGDEVIRAETPSNLYHHREALSPGRWFWRVETLGRAGRKRESSPARSFSITDEAAILLLPDPDRLAGEVPPHPRLFLGPEFRAWRTRAREGREPEWDLFVQQVNKALGSPPEPEPDHRVKPGDSWYENVHLKINIPTFRLTHRMLRSAFASLVTEDRRYTDEAIRLAEHLAGWNLDGTTGMKNADQAFREITLALGITFDWTHQALSPALRRQLADTIQRRGEVLHGVLGRRFLTNPFMSHEVTYLNFLLMISCATLGDLPRARDWFNYALPVYYGIMPVWGGDDGGISQGLHYLRLISHHTLLAADAVRSVTDFPIHRKPWLENVGYFFLYFLPPRLQKRYFGKSGPPESPGRVEKRMMERLAAVYRNGCFKWYAERTADDGRESFSSIGGGLEAFLWPPAPVTAEPPASLPGARLFPDVGWVAMHSDLATEDDIMLAFKSSPYGSFSHSQADQNSLVISAGGRPLLIDSGYSNEEDEHKAGYAIQTRAHNCVLVNGAGQRVHDWSASGTIVHFADQKWLSYACGDATAAYGGTVRTALRHVLHLKPRFFIVADEIRCTTDSRFQLLWHSLAPFDLEEDADGGGTVAATRNGPWEASLHTLWPARLNTRQGNDWGGIPPRRIPQEEIHEEWQLTLETVEQSRAGAFLTIIGIGREDWPTPMVSRVEADGCAAGVISHGGPHGGRIQAALQRDGRLWGHQHRCRDLPAAPERKRKVELLHCRRDPLSVPRHRTTGPGPG